MTVPATDNANTRSTTTTTTTVPLWRSIRYTPASQPQNLYSHRTHSVPAPERPHPQTTTNNASPEEEQEQEDGDANNVETTDASFSPSPPSNIPAMRAWITRKRTWNCFVNNYVIDRFPNDSEFDLFAVDRNVWEASCDKIDSYFRPLNKLHLLILILSLPVFLIVLLSIFYNNNNVYWYSGLALLVLLAVIESVIHMKFRMQLERNLESTCQELGRLSPGVYFRLGRPGNTVTGGSFQYYIHISTVVIEDEENGQRTAPPSEDGEEEEEEQHPAGEEWVNGEFLTRLGKEEEEEEEETIIRIQDLESNRRNNSHR